MAFGGLNQYTGSYMRNDHDPLIKEDFLDQQGDRVIKNLGESLNGLGLGLDGELIAEFVGLAISAPHEVLGRQA